MALRELLALFEMKVEGTAALTAANIQLDSTAQSAARTELAIAGLGAALQSALGGTFAGAGGDFAKQLGLSAEGADLLRARLANLDGDKLAALAAKLPTAEIVQLSEQAKLLAERFQISQDAALGLASQVSQINRAEAEAVAKQEQASHAASGWGRALGGVKAELIAVGGAFVAAFAMHGISAAISETLDLADAVGELGQRTGLTNAEVQTFQAYAVKSGDSADSLNTVVRKLSASMLEAKNGSAEAKKAFADLGVTVTDKTTGALRGIGPVLREVLGGLAKFDSAERLARAVQLLGRSATLWTTELGNSKEAFEANLDAIQRTAVVFSDDFVSAADATNDQLEILSQQSLGLKAIFVGATLPALRWVIDRLTQLFLYIRSVGQETKIFSRIFQYVIPVAGIAGLWVAIGRFGGLQAIMLRMLPLLRTLGVVVLRFMLPFLLFDDALTFLEGGDSALGRLLDRLFGAGAGTALLDSLKAVWEYLQPMLIVAGELLKAIFTGGDVVAAAQKLWDAVLAGATVLWAAIKRIGEAAGMAISAVFSNMWNDWYKNFLFVWDKVTGAVSGFFDGDVLGKLGGLIPDSVRSAVGFASSTETAMTGSAASAFTSSNQTLVDQRTLNINAQGATPGVVGPLSRAFSSSLDADSSATLNALARP